MSAILNKVIYSSILSIMGVFVVKKISDSNENIFKLKSLVLILFLIILPVVIYNLNYSYIFSIITYIMTIITYKYILNISFIKSTLSSGIMHVFLIILDFLSMCLLSIFVSSETIRNAWYISTIFNLLFAIILILLFYKTKLGDIISKIVNKIVEKRQTKIAFFFILVIVGMSIVLFLESKKLDISSIFTTNFALFIILFLLVIILFTERTSYDKLSLEYDNLFNYVKVFEEWIEKEQFIRHEYKNQLAVLRCMTKAKKVKDKIDSIILENINIDNQMISELKSLPNGGLKGLLYYKIAIARNKKINISIDVSNSAGKLLNKLSDEQIKVLSKLIGVYCDNAIEAALGTRKKVVSIEIYEYNKIIRLVISNSYNKKQDISRRNEKGFSTKGEGRGNGLYFSRKLLSKNKWIEDEQYTIDNFYIVKLSITTFKKDSK